MKNLLKLSTLLVLLFVGCKEQKKEKIANSVEKKEMSYTSYGTKITPEKALLASQMHLKFKELKVGDTLDLKFSSKINEVCTKKGCWMKVALDTETQTMVRFKDYGFFMPLDSKGKNVIIQGKAFVQETSVDDLRHYAQDAGKTEQEIAAIVQPKKEYTFLANGVLME